MNNEEYFTTSGTVGVAAAEVVGSAIKTNWRFSVMCFEVAATVLLQAFSVEVQMHADGEWVALNSAWAATGAILLFFSGNLAVCPAGGAESAIVKLNNVFAVRFKAQGNGGDSVVTIKGGFAA